MIRITLLTLLFFVSLFSSAQNYLTENGLKFGFWEDTVLRTMPVKGTYIIISASEYGLRQTGRSQSEMQFEKKFQNYRKIIQGCSQSGDSVSVRDGKWLFYMAHSEKLMYEQTYDSGIMIYEKRYIDSVQFIESNLDRETGNHLVIGYYKGIRVSKSIKTWYDGLHIDVEHYPDSPFKLSTVHIPLFSHDLRLKGPSFYDIYISPYRNVTLLSISSSTPFLSLSDSTGKTLSYPYVLEAGKNVNLKIAFKPVANPNFSTPNEIILNFENEIVPYRITCNTHFYHWNLNNKNGDQLVLSRSRDSVLILHSSVLNSFEDEPTYIKQDGRIIQRLTIADRVVYLKNYKPGTYEIYAISVTDDGLAKKPYRIKLVITE